MNGHHSSGDVRLRGELGLERGGRLSSSQQRSCLSLSPAFSAFASVPGANVRLHPAFPTLQDFPSCFLCRRGTQGCDSPPSLLGRAPDALLKETKPKLHFRRGSVRRGRDRVYRPVGYYHLTLGGPAEGLICHRCMAKYVYTCATV